MKKNIFKPLSDDIKDTNANGLGQAHWSEDQLLQQELKPTTTDKLITNKQLKTLTIILLSCFALLWFKTFYLQIVKGADFRQRAETIRVDIKPIKANRGIFFDSQKIPLVRNLPRFNLTIIPAFLPSAEKEKNDLIKEIAQAIEIDAKEIFTKINSLDPNTLEYELPLVISQHISREQALPLIVASSQWPGVDLQLSSQREYLTTQASQIIGYLGKVSETDLVDSNYLADDFIGKTGIEYSYEKELKGQNGRKRVEVDSLGKEIKILNQEPVKIGQNLILNIDLDLQEYLYQRISDILSASQATGAAAIMLEPNSGAILALVSLPSFDSNDFIKGFAAEEFATLINNPQKSLFNRAISGEYPPGSTIKPIIAAAALEENIIDENFTVNSTGSLTINQWYFPDWKTGGHGTTNLTKALSESVNTYFYLIGGGDNEEFSGLGVDRINRYAKIFGLEQKLGIDLPGEATGFLPTKEWKEKTKNEQWYIGDTYHLAIGQGDILVTPLQVASYTAVFANQGKLFQPSLLKEIRSANDQLVKEISPTLIRSNLVSQENIQLVRRGLRQAVLTGSARKLNNLPFSVAGKTGTAQFADDQPPHSWFTCFAPYEQPEIVLTILLEAGGEGSDYPVDLAKQLLYQYFTSFKI